METTNIHQTPYRDSPPQSPSPSRGASPSPEPTPSSHASTAKPPSQPASNHPLPQPLEPYRDDPTDDESERSSRQQRRRRHRPTISIPPLLTSTPPRYIPRYTDHDDDVPLAQLCYPSEAPPSYDVVVRESFRTTLIQQVRSTTSLPNEVDEEAAVAFGEGDARADDVRFTVEKVVAAIIVSMLLLMVAALLALVAVSRMRVGR